MATKLSDLSIDDIREILRATEISVGPHSTSARIIRRELERKVEWEETWARRCNSLKPARAAQ